MAQHFIPVMATAGPVSWAKFKQECTELYDRLAVEYQSEFPTHMLAHFPDLDPQKAPAGFLAARDEYVMRLEGIIVTLASTLAELRGQDPRMSLRLVRIVQQ